MYKELISWDDLMLGDVIVDPISVKETDLATKARSIIREEGIRTLVVLDENNNFSGILKRSDVLKIKDSKADMPARSITNKPLIYLYNDMDLRTASDKMIKNDLFDAPVFNRDNEFLGIVGLEDILVGARSKERKPRKDKVSELMHDGAFVKPDIRVTKIWSKLEEGNIQAFPVVEEVKGKNKLVGLISQEDLIAHRKLSLDMNEPPKVKKVMNRSPTVLSPEDSVEEAIELLIERDLEIIPVVDQGYFLKGLIDKIDLIKSLYSNL